MNGAQLFKCKDGLKFDPLQRDFEEAVWEFFGKEEKIDKSRVPYFAGDSHEGIIDFVAWSHDSNRVLLDSASGRLRWGASAWCLSLVSLLQHQGWQIRVNRSLAGCEQRGVETVGKFRG
jgi:hypothetical protein